MDGEDEVVEWDLPPPEETNSVSLEDQHKLRRLLVEAVITACVAPALIIIALCINGPLSGLRKLLGPSSGALWEVVIYQWIPPILFLAAFGCLVWLITIPLRMAALKKGDPYAPGSSE